MAATRSEQKKTTAKAGKARAPQATSQAASGTATRSRAKQQTTKSSTPSDLPASSLPPRTRSRATKTSGAPEQPASSSDPPPSSMPAPKTRGGKRSTKTSAAATPSASSSAAPSEPPAKNQTRKRKASTALEQSTPSTPPKAKSRRRVASKAPKKDSASAHAPMLSDAPKEKNDAKESEPVSLNEGEQGQDTDSSSLSSLESTDFDEETKNAVQGQTPAKAATVPTANQDSISSKATATTTSTPKPTKDLKTNGDGTAATTAQGTKSEVKVAPVSTTDLEPSSSTTTTNAANLPIPTPNAKANKRAASTARGRKSQMKATTAPKDSKKPTPTTRKTAAADVPDPVPAPRNDSDATSSTIQDQSLHTQAITGLDDQTTTTAANASSSIPALSITDGTTPDHAQGPKSSVNEKSTLSTSETPEAVTPKPQPQPTPAAEADEDAKEAHKETQAGNSTALSQDQCSLPDSAHEEAATGASEPGASNSTTAFVPGDSLQSKNVPSSHGTSLTSATMSASSTLSIEMNPPAPATTGATAETNLDTLSEKEVNIPLAAASNVTEDLLLVGQSFKVLWPVYEQVREIIEMKECQRKEVIEAERKLMWQLYEQCRELKTQLEDHEASKGEK